MKGVTITGKHKKFLGTIWLKRYLNRMSLDNSPHPVEYRSITLDFITMVRGFMVPRGVEYRVHTSYSAASTRVEARDVG